MNSFLLTHIGQQTEYDGVEYWSDTHDICGRAGHHDGVNYILFRQLKGTEAECSELLEAIANQQDYTTLLEKYSTSLLPFVAAVYGWPGANEQEYCQ